MILDKEGKEFSNNTFFLYDNLLSRVHFYNYQYIEVNKLAANKNCFNAIQLLK